MTIQQCKYVLAVAKTGSFNEAAKQLFVAQSSLSISIKSLEQELEIKIFERSGNGVYLTDEGAEFIKYASQICENSDFVTERYKKEISKKLYIATQHYDFIADIFGNFLKTVSSENYRFSIREIETYNVIRDVETARSDIGIIAIKNGDLDVMKRYLIKRNLSFTPVLEVNPHVFFRSQHPLSRCEKISMSDLKEYPYVSYEQGEHISSFFTEELADVSYIDKHIEISDRATLMNLLMLTDSYTIGTGIMPSALNKGDIISISFETDDSYIIGYLLNEERKISNITKEFIELIENDFSRREKLFSNTKLFAEKIKSIGLDVMDNGTPIIPVMLYDEHKAVEMAKRMMEKGVYVVAFSYPVVPKGKARIRTQLSAALSEEDILYIVDCFKQVKEEMHL